MPTKQDFCDALLRHGVTFSQKDKKKKLQDLYDELNIDDYKLFLLSQSFPVLRNIIQELKITLHANIVLHTISQCADILLTCDETTVRDIICRNREKILQRRKICNYRYLSSKPNIYESVLYNDFPNLAQFRTNPTWRTYCTNKFFVYAISGILGIIFPYVKNRLLYDYYVELHALHDKINDNIIENARIKFEETTKTIKPIPKKMDWTNYMDFIDKKLKEINEQLTKDLDQCAKIMEKLTRLFVEKRFHESFVFITNEFLLHKYKLSRKMIKYNNCKDIEKNIEHSAYKSIMDTNVMNIENDIITLATETILRKLPVSLIVNVFGTMRIKNLFYAFDNAVKYENDKKKKYTWFESYIKFVVDSSFSKECEIHDRYIYTELPKTLLQDCKFLKSCEIKKFLETNEINCNRKKELIDAGYSPDVFSCNLQIFEGKMSIKHDYGKYDSTLAENEPDDFFMFYKKYYEECISPANEPAVYKISFTLMNEYDVIKNKFKNSWDKCYSDVNRKKIFQLGITHTGAIVEISINNEVFGNVEIIYCKNYAIFLPPHYNKNIFSILPDELMKLLCESLRSYFPQIAIYGYHIAIMDFIPREISKKDILELQEIDEMTVYYDVYYDGPQKVTLRFLTFACEENTLRNTIEYQNNLRDDITSTIPHSHKKYTKTINCVIDALINGKFSNKQIVTINDTPFIKNILLKMFNIFRINGDKKIVQEICKCEMNEHGNLVFSYDDHEKLDGYYIADKFSGKTFSYLVYEVNPNKKDHIKIHTAYTVADLRHYGFVKMLYSTVIRYLYDTFGSFSFDYWVFTDKKQILENLLRSCIQEVIPAGAVHFATHKTEHYKNEGYTHNVFARCESSHTTTRAAALDPLCG